jgi:hypothetical protein
MRQLLLGLAFLTLAVMSGDLLAAAPQLVADAIIDYDRPPPTFGKRPKEVWYKHGQSIRIDSESVLPKSKTVIVHHFYTRPGQRFSFLVSRYKSDGSLRMLMLLEDPVAAPPLISRRKFTEVKRTLIGEHCRVWNVGNPLESGLPFVQSGCMTADGIDLERRQANIDAIFARRISREPVPADSVSIPLEVFRLTSWVAGQPKINHQQDFEVVLQAADPRQGSEILRRSGPWKLHLKDAPTSQSTIVSNEDAGLSISFGKGRNGPRRLSISRQSREPHQPPLDYAGEPITNLPGETILGEKCKWRDMMPGTADAGRHECRTADGIPLKISLTGWGSRTVLTAVTLHRSPQPIASALPGPDILSPATWGF